MRDHKSRHRSRAPRWNGQRDIAPRAAWRGMERAERRKGSESPTRLGGRRGEEEGGKKSQRYSAFLNGARGVRLMAVSMCAIMPTRQAHTNTHAHKLCLIKHPWAIISKLASSPCYVNLGWWIMDHAIRLFVFLSPRTVRWLTSGLYKFFFFFAL